MHGVYLEPTEANAVRGKAGELKVTITQILEKLIQAGLAGLRNDELSTWAAGVAASRKGRTAGGLDRFERAVLSAGPNGTHTEIAGRAGLFPRDAYNALRSLERRGTVRCTASEGLGRAGRPAVSRWELV